MTTPRLNRIFTVSGSSTRTERLPIRYGANDRQADGFSRQRGEWYPTDALFNALPDTAAMASDLVAFDPSFVNIEMPTVNADGSIQGGVTPLNSLLSLDEDQNHWLRITTPEAGASYVQFTVTFVRAFDDEVGISVEGGTLVGSDFALEQDTYTQFLFERHTSEQSITTTMNLPVWGELTERGSALGVISITSQDDPVTTGVQEEASAVVRYDDRLAIGMLLTDDLDRTWGIRGSRTIQDRRYLEFDLSREVQG